MSANCKHRRTAKRQEERRMVRLFHQHPFRFLCHHPKTFFSMLLRCAKSRYMRSYYRRLTERKKLIANGLETQASVAFVKPEDKKKHGQYIRAGIVSIEEVMASLEQVVEFCGVPVRVISKRYRTFSQKGVKCVGCGRTATHFAVEKSSYDHQAKFYHLNLYSLDKVGEEHMMTVDHIIPASKGGSNSVRNLEPMCSHCNSKKGNVLTKKDKMRGSFKSKGPNARKDFVISPLTEEQREKKKLANRRRNERRKKKRRLDKEEAAAKEKANEDLTSMGEVWNDTVNDKGTVCVS